MKLVEKKMTKEFGLLAVNMSVSSECETENGYSEGTDTTTDHKNGGKNGAKKVKLSL
jgi:hypothetical protein